jgi:hypothetical protein
MAKNYGSDEPRTKKLRTDCHGGRGDLFTILGDPLGSLWVGRQRLFLTEIHQY